MQRFLFATACLLLLAQSAAWAQTDQVDTNVKSEVRRLVRQLDADSRAQREEAEAALASLGPAAMEFLPEVTTRTPAEVKERSGRVRKGFEMLVAERAASPTTATLSGTMSLTEAFDALQQQTGNRIAGYQRSGGNVTLDFHDAPYWQVLDRLLDEGGFKINAYGGESDTHIVMARPDAELSPLEGAVYSGVFRFEATRLEARRDLRNPAIDGMQLTIMVAWEPRVRPISLQQSLENIVAVDDRGQELSIDQSRARLNASAESGITAVELRIPMELPARGAKQIVSLKGVLNALVPGSVETFEFTDLSESRDVEKRKAGVAVTFERLRKNVNVYEARIRVRFEDAAGALQSHRGWVFNNEAYMLDANGQKINNVGLQETRRSPGEVGVAYPFVLPDGPQGCTFVYKTPATILQLPVEYELKNIDLP